MDLVNETFFPAELWWGPSGEREIGAAVVVKATYEIGEGGLRVATVNPWPILSEDLTTPWGTFPAEGPSRKPWVDLIVLGFARPPGGEPLRTMTVALSAGPFRHELRVTGNRRWQKTLIGFRPTEPEPFRAMPLTWDRAFGGTSRCPTGPLPCADNAEGKGFVFEPDDADGVELPNVEDPGCLVNDPGEWPKPAGWAPYPLAGGYRLRQLMDAEGRARPFEEVERFTTAWAHPDLLVERLAAGEPVAVEGVTGGAPLRTTVPACPATLTIEAGSERRTIAFRLDTLVVVAEEKRLVARWRAATTVEMRPREERLARLVAG